MATKKNISQKQNERLIKKIAKDAFDYSVTVYELVKAGKIKRSTFAGEKTPAKASFLLNF